ncbi:MAG: hypothetical protein HPY53_01440 [Brevinematales bacterium]|nr:hypothetical protein [Brevinematales bacterium]
MLDFPEVTDVEIAFGGYPKEWFKKILDDNHTGDFNEMETLFSNLFYHGGNIPVNKKLPKDYISKGIRLLKAIMGSFAPKHEEKERVCAVILKALNSDLMEK